MSRTLTIPEHLYLRLAAKARSEGLASVEEWLQNLAVTRPRRNGRKVSAPVDDKEQHPPAVGHALDDFIGDWSEADAHGLLGEVAGLEETGGRQ